MKLKIEILTRGVAHSLEKRDDLEYITSDDDIRYFWAMTGGDTLDEDTPTAMWVQIIDGEIGDAFATWSNRPHSIYCHVFEITREWTE